MSWGFVAVAGATVVSGAMSSRSASKASKSASDSEGAQLAFAQEQYDDWRNTFGPIQDNLSNYYSSITPEQYEAVGLEAIESEFTNVQRQAEQSLAQRGIQNSGLATALKKDIDIAEAEARATVRRDAPAMAAEEQSRFLQIGMGSNPSGSISQALGSAAAGARQRSNVAAQSEAAAWGSAVNIIGTGLSDYFNKGTNNA